MASVFDGVWGFSFLSYEPKSDNCGSRNVSFPWPETVGCNVVFIWGRNNVTKIQINIGMVPLLYSTDFQVLGPGAVFNVLYILYILYYTLLQYSCVTILCYTLLFLIFYIFPCKF